MSAAPQFARAEAEPAPQGEWQYTFLCLLAGLVLALPLLARDLGAGALLPVLFALFLPLVRLRAGPVLLLGSLGWTILADRFGTDGFTLASWALSSFLEVFAFHSPRLGLYLHPWPRLREPNPPLDLLLSAAVLVWIASYCRLLSVTWTIFPIDKRRQRAARANRPGTPSLGPIAGQKRWSGLIDGQETVKLLVAAALCVVLAQLVYRWLGRRVAWIDLAPLVPRGLEVHVPDGLWRLMILLWAFAVVLIVATGLLAVLGYRRMTPAETALYLQDQLWRQTRREQARLNRWLAWAEKRKGRV